MHYKSIALYSILFGSRLFLHPFLPPHQFGEQYIMLFVLKLMDVLL